MASEGRIICCCQAETWARVIAWLQIILNTLSAIIVILGLTGVAFAEPKDADEKSLKGAVLALLIVTLAMAIVGITFAVLLLLGANQRRPAYLKAWIIFTAILLIWSIIGAALDTKQLIWIRVLKCLLQLLINGFGIWVVNTLKLEIESEGPRGQHY